MSCFPLSMRIEAACYVSAYLPTKVFSSQALEMPLSTYESRIQIVMKLTNRARFGVQRLSIDSTRYTQHLTSGTSSRLSTRRICGLSI